MTGIVEEETMTANKAGSVTREEAKPTAIDEEPQAREALMALGSKLRTSSREMRFWRRLSELIRKLEETIARDAEIRTQRRRPAPVSRPVNSLIKQEKP